MKIKFAILFITIFFFITACYGSMTGTVVDAETGKPIEGAVVLIEWTKKKGIGDYHTESVKVVEAVTDKDGKFTVSGILDPFVDPPDVTVYKKGYVAWSNLMIFPDSRKRDDFQWRSGYVIKLEKFKDTYSYDDHYYFITSAARPESATKEKKLFLRAYNEWEREKAIKDRQERQRGGAHK